jgi:hypothetical protein
VEVGQHVRLALLDKRKAALSKGHIPNWSAIVYEAYKIKRPKSALSSLPLKFCVRTIEDGDLKNKGTPIAYATKDVQLISNEVMKAPLENVVVEKAGVSTRSKEKETDEAAEEEAEEEEAEEDEAAEAKPKPKPPTKAKTKSLTRRRW